MALVASVPAPCLQPSPLLVAACDPIEAPIEACLVERLDEATGRTTERFRFLGHRLLRIEADSLTNATSTSAMEYDTAGRLVRRQDCVRWTTPRPRESRVRTEITYLGDTDRPAQATITSTWQEGSSPGRASLQRICYEYAGARRLRRFEVTRNDVAGPATQITVWTNTWDGGARTTFESRVLQLSGAEITQRYGWTAHFQYDPAGRLLGHTEGNLPLRADYEYDRAGHLLTVGAGLTYTWDEAGHLMSNSGNRPEYNGRYRYDRTGRIEAARFEDGHGWRIRYSERCPAGLAHPRLTPNVDGHLYYEGRDTL